MANDENEVTGFASFRHFDPKEGNAPDAVEGKFINVAARARQILGNRSRDEIIRIADLFDWLVQQDCVMDQEWDQLAQEAEGQSSVPTLSDIGALANCTDSTNLSAFDQTLENLSWPEAFAARALSDIAEAADWLHFHADLRSRDPDDPICLKLLGPYAVEAIESVALAESFARLEQVREKVQEETISAVRSRAAYASHKARNNLKRKLFEYYENGSFRSPSAAVKQFIEEHDPDVRAVLAPTNAERTLREALWKYLKTPA